MAAHHGQESQSDWGLWITVTVVILLFLLFTYGFKYVEVVWAYIRLSELYMISWLPDELPLIGETKIQYTIDKIRAHQEAGLHLTQEEVAKIDYFHALRWSMPLGLIVIWLGWKKMNETNDVSTIFNIESLLRHFSNVFPFTKPYLEKHPEHSPMFFENNRDNNFAMALSPERFAAMVPPLGLRTNSKEDKRDLRPILVGDSDFDSDLARRAFDAQLGRIFKGIQSLNSVELKVFKWLSHLLNYMPAYEILVENEKTKFIKLAANNKKKVKFKLSKEQESHLKNKAIRQTAEQVMFNHGFIRTGLMSLLEEARLGGVVTVFEQSWIKTADRTLWYCLESCGRKVSFTEAGGCFAHWLLEKQIGRPIFTPETKEAEEGLYNALGLNINFEDYM